MQRPIILGLAFRMHSVMGGGVCMIVIVQESMTAMSLVEHQIA